jgi:hypothetical protein
MPILEARLGVLSLGNANFRLSEGGLDVGSGELEED